MTTPTKPEIAAALTGIPVATICALMEGRAVAVPRDSSGTLARIARCSINEVAELRMLLGLNPAHLMAPVGIDILAAATETGSHE